MAASTTRLGEISLIALRGIRLDVGVKMNIRRVVWSHAVSVPIRRIRGADVL